jgi:hypothetical protein
MQDPISLTVALAGETAYLLSPATTAGYDPGASDDYQPNPPGSIEVRGVPETKIEHVAGATGAFTFQASSKPAGLKANASLLDWRGEIWTVLRIRHRTWRGRTNGFTLYLGA